MQILPDNQKWVDNCQLTSDISKNFTDWLPSAHNGPPAQTKTAPEGAAYNHTFIQLDFSMPSHPD